MVRRILRLLRHVVVALACIVIAAVSAALLYREYRRHTVAQERAIHSPRGIDSLVPVRIGGITQWIEVRGQDVNNPILLFIHGGPGIAFIPLTRSFQGLWEKDFTVVQWDQRGAGKTYASNDQALQRATLNVPQMEQDALGVVHYLRRRFHRDRIVVVGHSWGSVLGLWLAHDHPELLSAYVGVGQVVSMEKNDETAYEDALREARDRHNAPAIRELQRLAPFSPADAGKQFVARRWEEQLLGPPQNAASFTNVPRLLSDVLTAPEYSLSDDFAFVGGQAGSLQVMLPQVAKIDLTQLGYDFRTPVFFFEGRRDPYCRPALIQTYEKTIDAPQKEFVWFDHSGHFPFYEERQKFAGELTRLLLPVATSRP